MVVFDGYLSPPGGASSSWPQRFTRVPEISFRLQNWTKKKYRIRFKVYTINFRPVLWNKYTKKALWEIYCDRAGNRAAGASFWPLAHLQRPDKTLHVLGFGYSTNYAVISKWIMEIWIKLSVKFEQWSVGGAPGIVYLIYKVWRKEPNNQTKKVIFFSKVGDEAIYLGVKRSQLCKYFKEIQLLWGLETLLHSLAWIPSVKSQKCGLCVKQMCKHTPVQGEQGAALVQVQPGAWTKAGFYIKTAENGVFLPLEWWRNKKNTKRGGIEK